MIEPVVRVSTRLIAAARRSLDHGARARALCWVIGVYEDDAQHHSFVRPDGGIVVYSGSFRYAQTEAGLAALLSHEFAHALADPVVPVSRCDIPAAQQPATLYTLEDEWRADESGLTLMAEAGYDPHELLRFWERMKPQPDGADDPVLVHINYDRRMEQIAQQLPHALIRYERTNRAPQKALPLK